MQKIYAFSILLIITFSALPLFSLEMNFSNDGLGWGFMPEWDDYETYSFTVLHDVEAWSVDLNFLCYTDRARNESDSSRIDCVLLEAVRTQGISLSEDISLNLIYGGIFRAFNNWQGLLIQTGWHGNVEVLREVPETYENPYLQVLLPVSASVLGILPGLSVTAGIQAGWPFELVGEVETDFLIEEPLQLDLRLGYRRQVTDSPSKAYSKAAEIKQGLFIESDLDFWPFFVHRSHYLQSSWGTGSIGIRVTEPKNPPHDDMISQIIISGITHQTYGVKINYTLLSDILIENLGMDATFTSIYGWLDTTMAHPKGARDSEITLGAEPFYSIHFGPLRLDPFIKFGCGLNYRQFYDLNPTVLAPYFTQTSLTLGAGGGIRFFFPFFYDRMLGFSIDGGWSLPVLSTGKPQDIPTGSNFNAILTLAVTG